jgi:CubicO group peptidase (beta-lactamase class C family)
MQRRTFLEGFAAALWKQGPPPSFNAQLLDLMQVAPVPGAVAGALHHGKPAWIQPFGVRNAETKQPVAADTVFQAASLSKQIAAYAAFALRDAGKLDFDRPLFAYLDDLPDPGARLVTARHVLSHTTGFPNWRSEAGQKLVPEFAPGERFQYSGEG